MCNCSRTLYLCSALWYQWHKKTNASSYDAHVYCWSQNKSKASPFSIVGTACRLCSSGISHILTIYRNQRILLFKSSSFAPPYVSSFSNDLTIPLTPSGWWLSIFFGVSEDLFRDVYFFVYFIVSFIRSTRVR